jgi:hypothetical protein
MSRGSGFHGPFDEQLHAVVNVFLGVQGKFVPVAFIEHLLGQFPLGQGCFFYALDGGKGYVSGVLDTL